MDRGSIFAGPQRSPEGLPPIGQNTNVFRPGQGMQPAPGATPSASGTPTVHAPGHTPEGPEVKPRELLVVAAFGLVVLMSDM